MGLAALFVPAITRLDDAVTNEGAGAAIGDDPVAVPASAR
jgi:hypothetical protein